MKVGRAVLVTPEGVTGEPQISIWKAGKQEISGEPRPFPPSCFPDWPLSVRLESGKRESRKFRENRSPSRLPVFQIGPSPFGLNLESGKTGKFWKPRPFQVHFFSKVSLQPRTSAALMRP
jgi:hypothetical protein